ncbi:MAG: hypothetical protein NT150_03590 [Bacteroidetes bacterium]|nr:hypothetical protein [Bacteroidota bacterium]
MKTKMILMAVILSGFTSMAQQGVTFFRVITTPQSALNLTPMMTPEQADAAINAVSHTVTYVIELESDSLVKAYVKLGADSTYGTYNQVLNLDGSNLPAGTTIEKSGNNVRITLGTFTGLAHYSSQIEIESAKGIKSKKFVIVH